jgi:hypothetical protein
LEGYLGTDDPYLLAMASAGARRYQSIQHDWNAKQRNRTREPAVQDKVGGVMPAGLFSFCLQIP